MNKSIISEASKKITQKKQIKSYIFATSKSSEYRCRCFVCLIEMRLHRRSFMIIILIILQSKSQFQPDNLRIKPPLSSGCRLNF